MKTWILKSDLSHSPQAAFRMYACGVRRPNTRTITKTQQRHGFFVSKIKSQIRSLAKSANQGTAINVEKIC